MPAAPRRRSGPHLRRAERLSQPAAVRLLAALALLALSAVSLRSEPLLLRIEPQPGATWTAVNDAVMGGVSEGRIERAGDGTLVFRGDVSFEHNGGFASARRPVTLPDLANASLRLEAAGDGKRYKLALYPERGASGASYQAEFDTRAGETLVVELPVARFSARFRGRLVADAPPLALARVTALGLLIADRQKGPFRLEIRSITLMPLAQ